MPPLFSVVIPTYNRAHRILRAVESVLSQTFKDFEIWVIDDGSVDDTEAVLRPFEGRLNYWHQRNGGVANARNTGIEKSRGAYIAFLDSDDWWYPRKLEVVARAIEENPSAGLFYSKFDVSDHTCRKLWTPHIRGVSGHAYKALLVKDFVATSTAVVRKDCFDQAGMFDTALSGCEDWDMWIRIARFFPIQFIPEILVAYERLSPDSLGVTTPWVTAAEEVVNKAIYADDQLEPVVKRQMYFSLAFFKGLVHLGRREDALARKGFRTALSLNPLAWKAWIYLIVLSFPTLRRRLPQRIKLAMRLPEA